MPTLCTKQQTQFKGTWKGPGAGMQGGLSVGAGLARHLRINKRDAAHPKMKETVTGASLKRAERAFDGGERPLVMDAHAQTTNRRG